jgi:protein involved in polysaccharide export with SLBB domain
MPLVGEIAANRLTTRELEEAIKGRLRDGGYLLNPQVGVQVLTYRPFLYPWTASPASTSPRTA